jgi:hypothetical protein
MFQSFLKEDEKFFKKIHLWKSFFYWNINLRTFFKIQNKFFRNFKEYLQSRYCVILKRRVAKTLDVVGRVSLGHLDNVQQAACEDRFRLAVEMGRKGNIRRAHSFSRANIGGIRN